MNTFIRYNNNTNCVRLCPPKNYKGPPGPKGPKGDTGSQGPKGDTGAVGPNVFKNYTISSIITNSTYNIDYSNDYDVYQVDTSSNNITVILPEINNLTNNKRMYIISDVGGNLLNNHLIIQTSGSDTVANETSVTLTINYSSITLISNTNNVWIIS